MHHDQYCEEQYCHYSACKQKDEQSIPLRSLQTWHSQIYNK